MSSFFTPAMGLFGLGSLGSTVGSALGGSSANRAGRKARDWYDTRTGEGAERLSSMFFGPGTGYMDRPWSEEQQRAFMERIGGPIFEQLRGLAGESRERGRGMEDLASSAFPFIDRRGIEDRQAMERGYAGLGGNVRDFFRGARGMADQAFMRPEATARQFGREQEGVLRGDYAERLKDADQAAKASMAGLGANTLVGNQLAGNRRVLGRELDRGLADVAGMRAQMLGQAQTNRAGAQQGLLAQEGSILPALGQAGLASSERMREGGTQRQMQQVLSLLALMEGNLGRDLGMSGDPLRTALNVGQGGVMNPWLGQPTTQFYPGYSAAGTGLAGIGGSMAGLGAYGLGRAPQNNMSWLWGGQN
ncbi:MAG: hypothetical protein KIS87_08155 [Phycisphaeraceae bacterium]|nr:hypothetical protein [Phycisphaeraceae bacterium]